MSDAEQFAIFWQAYPARDGKKLDRGKTFTIWRRMCIDDRRAAVRGARHYAASGVRAKDPLRWLRDRCWDDWQTPATVDAPAARKAGRGPSASDFAAAAAEAAGEMGSLWSWPADDTVAEGVAL